MAQKSNVLIVLNREFILRDTFDLKIDPMGTVEEVTNQHLFLNSVLDLHTLVSTRKMIGKDAQEIANRSFGRGVPMNIFVVRVNQHFVQQDSLAPVDWWFDMALFVKEDDDADTSENNCRTV